MSDDYGIIRKEEVREIAPPAIDYSPPRPRAINPGIGLIGTGGISETHLKAYRKQGFNLIALTNRTRSKAEEKRDRFFPEAEVLDSVAEMLARPDIAVIDVTLHPEDRIPVVRAALEARKHVLSQKPFVLDLDVGEELIKLAHKNGVKLAVNQNARWAPHFCYLRKAIEANLLGKVISIDVSLQWDHTWITNIPEFNGLKHLILFDFAIHWFDAVHCLMKGRKARKVYATATRFSGQAYDPPALASVIIEYEDAEVRLNFNAHAICGEEDVITVVGTTGILRSRGPNVKDHPFMEVFLEEGAVKVPLEGGWFEEGFEGTMAELLCAIEENREPEHSAQDNLSSLALCFAAIASAERGVPVEPGSVRSLEACPLDL